MTEEKRQHHFEILFEPKKREKSKSIFVKKLKRFHDDHIEIVAWGIYQKILFQRFSALFDTKVYGINSLCDPIFHDLVLFITHSPPCHNDMQKKRKMERELNRKKYSQSC